MALVKWILLCLILVYRLSPGTAATFGDFEYDREEVIDCIYDEDGNEIFREVIDTLTVITGYNGAGGTVEIPDVIDGFPVTGIEIFSWNQPELTCVIIPETVRSIQSAFLNCTGLAAIVVHTNSQYYSSENGILFDYQKTALLRCPPAAITGTYTVPDSVFSIGAWAFAGCAALTDINITDSVSFIGQQAFAGCATLTNMNIPSSVMNIGGECFSACPELMQIAVSDDNPAYCSENGILFNKDETALIYFPAGISGDYCIPDGVIRIEDGAFSSTSLTTVLIPAGIVEFGDYGEPFQGGSRLTAIHVDTNNLHYSSRGGVLFDKEQTVLMRMPQHFQGSYIVPDGVTMFWSGAFDDCTGLTRIDVPASFVFSGFDFRGCVNLACVNVDENNPVFSSEDGVVFDKDKTTLLCCPEGVTGAYTVPDDVARIESFSFSGCSKIISVTVPGSVTSMGLSVFRGCTALIRIIFLGDVPEISSGASSSDSFGGCSLMMVSAWANLTNAWWSGITTSIFRAPPAWLEQHGLADESTDADDDGMVNWQEYIAGTSPTNAASSLLLTYSRNTSSEGDVLCWSSVSNRFYTLSMTTNLLGSDTFSALPDAIGLPSTPPQNCYTNRTVDGAPRFYKISVSE